MATYKQLIELNRKRKENTANEISNNEALSESGSASIENTSNSSSRFNTLLSQSRALRNKERETEQAENAESNNARLNAWFSDAQKAFGSADSYLSNTTYSDMLNKSDTVTKALNSINTQSVWVEQYLKKYEGTEDGEPLVNAFKEYKNILNNYQSKANLQQEYAESFNDENEYNNALREAKYANYSYDDLQNELNNFDENSEDYKWLTKKSNEVASSEELLKELEPLQEELDSLEAEYKELLKSSEENHTPSEREKINERLDYIEKTRPTLQKEVENKKRQVNAKTSEEQDNQYNNAMLEKYGDYSYEQLFAEAKKFDDNSNESNWLKNAGYEKASSEDLQSEYDKLTDEYNSLYDNRDEEENYNRLKEIEQSKGEFENQISKKKQEERVTEFNNLDEETRNIISAKGNINYWSPTNWFGGDEDTKKAEENFNDLDMSKEDKNKYLETYNRMVESYNAELQHKVVQEQAESNPVLASVISIGNNTIGSIPDAFKYIGANIDKANGGDGYVNPRTTNVSKAQTARETVSKDMNGIGSFLYNAGMSMADFTVLLPLNLVPGGQAGSLAVMGTSAGVSSANTVIENGGDLNSAISTGLAAGTAEVLLEKFSLGELKALKVKGTDSIKKAIFKNALVEGSEEVGTDIANAITDQIINGDMSQLSQQYQNYIKQGYTEDEAWKMCAVDFGAQVGQSFAGGAISGGVLGGGAIGLNYATNKIENSKSVVNNKVGKAVKENENVNGLIETAKKLSTESKAYRVATQLEEQQKNNKKVSSSKVGQLRSLIIEQSQSEFDTEYKKVTENLHEDEKAVVDKLLNREALSEDEVKIVNNNDVLKNSIADVQKKFNNLYSSTEIASKAPFKSIKSIDDNTDKIDESKLKISEDGKTKVNDEVYDGAMEVVRTNPFAETVTYKMEKNGEVIEVNSKNIEFRTKEEAKLNALASKYNVQTAQKFLELYEKGQNVNGYSEEFNLFQNYGRLAVPLTDDKMNTGFNLNPAQKMGAYEAGLTSRKSYYQEQNIISSNVKNSKYYAYTKGNFNASAIKGIKLDETQRAFYNFFREFALRTGINVELFSSKVVEGEYKGEQGSWNKNTKTIRVDINAGLKDVSDFGEIKHGMLNTFSHELTHIAEHSGFYDELHEAIVSALEKRGTDFNKLVEKKKEQLRSNPKTKPMSDEELTYLADVEVIANNCETMLKNSKIFEDIAQGNPTLAQKIKDKLKNFIARLKQLLNKTNALTPEGKLLEECVTEFENINRIWDKAVTDGIKTVNAMHADQKNNTADNSDMKKQLRSIPEEKEISANIKVVANMKPVATLSGSEFSKSKTDLVTQVTDYFDEIGGCVNTEYGKIELTKSGVKSSIGHGIGRNKAIAFKAVPDVLKEGKIIDFQNNWKNRGYDTAVFAAPIKIADKDYFMAAVIVVETERNSYYLHEVAIQEKEDNTLFKTGTVKNGTSGKVLSSPIFTLLQKLQSVKNESEDNTEYQSRITKIDNEYLEAVDSNDIKTVNAMQAEQKNNTADNSDVKYSIRQTQKMGYLNQLEQIENNKLNGSNSLYIGIPSDDLVKVGFSKNPFAMNQKDYRKSRRDSAKNKHYSSHGVPLKFFNVLPQKLNSVAMLIDNEIKITAITDFEMKDTKGNKSFVVVGLWQNQEMESDKVNLVKSVYPLDDIAQRIINNAEQNKLIVINKNKAKNMLTTIGIQPSEVSRILNLSNNSLSQENKDVKYQFGGRKAETANNSLLDKAIEMENRGKDSEIIRQKTGWFRGMDSKWRFEIDDSKMRFYKVTKQDIKNIEEYKNNKIRYNGLSRKIANNTATAEQQQSFKAAEKYIKEYETSQKLSDYVSHPELFKAYPQLKEVNFYFDTISVKGAYYPDSNAIVINPTLSQVEQRESVIHEIQHAIQNIEGFADGSTMAQWQNKGADSFTAYNNYRNTAGEIEARDTASRLNFNAEQRKNIRPDIDRKDVVFADNNSNVKNQSRDTKPDYNFSKALSNREWSSFYSSLEKSNQRDSFRIGDNGILIPDENNSKNYKLVCYEGDSVNTSVTAVYKLLNYDYNIHSKQPKVAELLIKLERNGYNDKQARTILQNYTSVYGTLFQRYNNKSGKFVKLTRESIPNRKNDRLESDGTGTSENVEQGIPDSGVDNVFPQFQMRPDNGFANRRLLANALENSAQNNYEKNKVKLYKENIDQIDELEARLDDVNKKIKKVSSVKAAERTREQRTELMKLNNVKKILQDKIVRKDKQLLNFESMEPMKKLIESEKKKAYDKARLDYKVKLKESQEKHNAELASVKERDRERIAEVRESKDKIIVAEREKRKTMVKGVRNARDKKEIIRKIKKKLKDIDKLLNRSKADKTVKQGLRDTASKLLSLKDILLDTNLSNADIVRRGIEIATPDEQKLLKEYLSIIGETDTELSEVQRRKVYQLNSKLKDLFIRERERLNRATVKQALTELSETYKSVENAPEAYLRNSFDKNIIEAIDNLKEEIGGTLVKDMNVEQVQELHDIVTMILTSIRNANKHFAENIKTTCEETSSNVMNEILSVKGPKEVRNLLANKILDFQWRNLKPIYAFRLMGSKTFEKIYWNLQKGELDWYIDIAEAKQFKEECEEKYGYKSFDFKKTFEFTAMDGSTFTLDLNQMMDIYAASRRTQALQHLLKGGFTFEKDSADGKLKVKTGAKAYPLTMSTIQSIANGLSENEKGYAEAMQKYLSEAMAKKGNEVSMALYGVEMFNEDTYWSISSSDTFLKVEENETTGEFKVKNFSFTKSTIRNASNPIVLRGFEENWCNHVNQMSLYHAMTLPLEDFTKIFNYNTGVRTNEENPTAVTGVRSVIKGAFGNSAEHYFRQFIRDLNGGIREASRIGIEDNMIALAKKASVFANLSVVLQQPSAIFRAMAYVDKRYFLPEPNKLVRLQNHRKDWEQLKKYAPIAGIKEMGMFDTGTGKGVLEWLSSGKRDSVVKKTQNKIDDVGSWLPAKADEYAWVKLWHATQRETRVKHGLAIGTEENLIKSGERFNEVVHLTQVYDSVLSRSGAMRSSQTFNKMATSFMAESTTVMNMAVDAVVQLKRNGKSGIGQFAKSASAILVSILANSLLLSFSTAGRDDDEDETYSNKYWQAFWKNLTGWGGSLNPLTYYPIMRDLMSVLEGYAVERMDMSLVSDFIVSLKKLTKEDGTTTNNILDFVGCIANLFGLPVRNIIRDFSAVINTYNTLTTEGKDPIISLEISMPTDYQEAYDKYWKEGYTEEDCKSEAASSVKSKIRKKLRPVYLKALKNQDSATVANIRRYMRDSGFYNSLNGVDEVLKGWRKSSDEEEERAQRAEERK